MVKRIFAVKLVAFLLFNGFNTYTQEIGVSTENLKYHIQVLASDSLQGRFPGTLGDSLSTDYISQAFSSNEKSIIHIQNFNIVTGIKIGDNNFLTIGDPDGEMFKDYSLYAFSANAKLSAETWFCSYGNELTENDFEKLVNKWVIVLRDPPAKHGIKSISDRDKAMMFADKNVGGIIFVAHENDYQQDKLVEIQANQGKLSIPVLNMSRDAAVKYFGADFFVGDISTEKAIVNTGIYTDAQTELGPIQVETNNIYSIIKGNHPELSAEYVVIGAHYDHLGYGGNGSSSRRQDTIAVHYGADDNASGVAAILELNRMFSEQETNRSYVFVAFGAEEKGLLGSKYFTENFEFMNSVTAMINLDMIGRQKENKSLQIGGTGSSLEAEELLKANNKLHEFALVFSPEGYGPSDHAPFYAKDIPVFFISTGAHADYHTPDDKSERINYSGIAEITNYVYTLILSVDSLANPLTFQEAGPKESATARHGGERKVSLGLMPDFSATDIQGLRADIVSPGKPAAAGGMKNGDIIKAINGNPVRDIQEYMYRLSQLNLGEQVTVDVERDGELIVLIIQV